MFMHNYNHNYLHLITENAGETAAQKLTENANNEIERVSTRDWAQDVDYNHAKLFNKVNVNRPFWSYILDARINLVLISLILSIFW